MNRAHHHSWPAAGTALLCAIATLPLAADTVAYWRFEGSAEASPAEGAFIQDTDGRTAVQSVGIPVPDASGNGNALYNWSDDQYSGHVLVAAAEDAPYPSVPLTDEPNGWFVENTGDYPASFTWSTESSPAGTNLDTWTASTWTIEASIRSDSPYAHRTFVGREGNGVATGDAAHAPLYFQTMPNGAVRIRYVDAAGNIHSAEDFVPIVAGFWYHFAATCDGTTLRLWKRETGGLFEEVATVDVSGSSDPALVDPGVDANGDPWGWTVGRGRYGTSDDPNVDHGDRWLGAIDEVRISDTALSPAEFLAAFPATAEDSDADGLPDAWEESNFSSLLEGPADDFDFDYATNLVEFRNSTDPTDEEAWPDADADDLNDGWEAHFFPNPPPNTLAAAPDADPDGDYNDNLAEFLAFTEPTNALSYPDEDFDWINDGWERFYFPEASGPEDVDPFADDDGDIFTNLEEFEQGGNPADQLSSPDTDGDGLPDGWEVKFFRTADESLATLVTYQDGSGDPDGDGLSNKFEQVAGTDPNDSGSRDPLVGYWRFEEATNGEVPAGGNQQWAFPTSIQDSSNYGNHMMAWADYSAPNYSPVVPGPTVPATGAGNTASLFFLPNDLGRYYIEAIFSTPTEHLGGGESTLRTAVFEALTVEASFNTDLSGVWQVPLAKFGNPVGGQPPFSIKIDGDNLIRAGLVDGSGTSREIIGTTPVVAGSWFSVAVTVTGTEMRLWVKGPDDSSYALEGTTDVSGAWFVPEEGPLDSVWNIGAGEWNGNMTDVFAGYVDEVRISAVALPESEFLFSGELETGFPAWAEAGIPDPSQRGESDDPDRDGTVNLVEYLLGLGPMDPGSSFATGLSGDTLEWPAAEGLVFTVQRSLSLAAWDDVAQLTATGSTASWTDPTPPEGKAFYRVVLPTE